MSQRLRGRAEKRFLVRAPMAARFAGLFLMAALVQAAPALAQGQSVGSLVDRLERLERDLRTLQREFYRDGASATSSTSASPSPASPSPASPTSGTAAAPSSLDAPSAAARAELRFAEMEAQIRSLTGQMEEMRFKFTEIGDRLDRLTGDLELRLGALEQGGTGQAGLLNVPQPGVAAMQTPETPPAAVPTSEPVEATANVANLSPREAYNHAFSLLSSREYAEAERELKAFLEAHPDDALVPNATYWLGETYYVRNDFRQASVTFLQGYQKDPKGSKAPDNLLKLAKSLGNLREKKQACATLDRLKKEFPNLPAGLRQRATDERKRNGCT